MPWEAVIDNTLSTLYPTPVDSQTFQRKMGLLDCN